jgi:Dolichyl-phosphate-mannose-protein mannosyltransferase
MTPSPQPPPARGGGVLVGGVLLLHVLIWWLLPALLQHNLPLDVIEQLAWGREWRIVYFKHPPLPAWILESIAVVSGRWPPAIYLSGSVASALALWAIWRLGRELLGPRRALFAVLAQECVLYFTFFTPEFNHNVVLLPLWAAIGLAGYRACFGKGSWIWLGVLMALGMLGKYTTALLLVSLLGLAVLHPRLRQLWRRPGPYVAGGVALVLLLPHLMGLWRIGFAPLYFPFERAPAAHHWYDHFVYPILFAAAQLGGVAPALLAVALLGWRRQGEALAEGAPRPLVPEARAFLWTITWAPAALAVAASLLLGLHLKDMWGSPMWCFIGLFLTSEVVGPITTGGVQRLAIAWAVVMVTVAGVFTVQQTAGGYLISKPTRGQFPGRELAALVEQRWHQLAGGAPLAIVAGDVWLAGNIAFYGKERPSVFIDADPRKSPWISPAALAREGAVFIWQEGAGPPPRLDAYPAARPERPIELPYVPPLGHAPGRFGWAVLAPTQ